MYKVLGAPGEDSQNMIGLILGWSTSLVLELFQGVKL
jgi:hypothetical protein